MLPYGLNSKKFYDDLKKIARLEELVSQETLSRDFAQKYKRNYKKKKTKKKSLTQIWAENELKKSGEK